jgi:hypothetical protein
MNDLTLICHGCKFPVGDGDGWLRIMLSDIHVYRDAERAYRAVHPEGEAMSLAGLLLAPEPVHWRAYHAHCETEPQEGAYQIGSERVRTWAQFAHWTAHLMEKNWFQLTDWDCLLREVAGDSPAETIQVLERAS